MQFALAINRNMPDPLTNFCASPSWLNRFKKHAGLANRRVTRFVQKRSFFDQGRIEEPANKFVEEIRHEMEKVSLECVINVDQSALAKETTVS